MACDTRPHGNMRRAIRRNRVYDETFIFPRCTLPIPPYITPVGRIKFRPATVSNVPPWGMGN